MTSPASCHANWANRQNTFRSVSEPETKGGEKVDPAENSPKLELLKQSEADLLIYSAADLPQRALSETATISTSNTPPPPRPKLSLSLHVGHIKELLVTVTHLQTVKSKRISYL